MIASLLLLAGCRQAGEKTSSSEARDGFTVTDFRGKELHFDKTVERVVCLIESAFSGICMLQAQDKVVGVASDVYNERLHFYYAQLDDRIRDRTLAAPGNWDFISIEQVVGLEPDLVIAWSSQTEAIAAMERLGLPVYAVMLHGFEDVYKEMEDLGRMLGRSERADSLIRYTRQALDEGRDRQLAEDTAKVYFMWAQGIHETSGSNSTVEELLHHAGTSNACDLEQEHVTVSVEKLVDWAPDMIVMWHNEKLDPGDILEDPLLQGVKAVQDNRVYELPGVFLCDFWTLKMQYPVKLISGWAYPGMEPGADGLPGDREMLALLYGKELEVHE